MVSRVREALARQLAPTGIGNGAGVYLALSEIRPALPLSLAEHRLQAGESPEDLADRREAAEDLWGAILAMPPRDCWVLLRHLAGVPLSVIADEAGVSRQRAGQIYRRAVRRLGCDGL